MTIFSMRIRMVIPNGKITCFESFNNIWELSAGDERYWISF